MIKTRLGDVEATLILPWLWQDADGRYWCSRAGEAGQVFRGPFESATDAAIARVDNGSECAARTNAARPREGRICEF
jgi:hypothetical protein